MKIQIHGYYMIIQFFICKFKKKCLLKWKVEDHHPLPPHVKPCFKENYIVYK